MYCADEGGKVDCGWSSQGNGRRRVSEGGQMVLQPILSAPRQSPFPLYLEFQLQVEFYQVTRVVAIRRDTDLPPKQSKGSKN